MGDLIIPPIIDYDEIAKRVWERLIPAVPVSGAFEEKVKEAIISHAVIQSYSSVSIPAGSVGTFEFQPPSGETWEVNFWALLTGAVPGSYIHLFLHYEPLFTPQGHSWDTVINNRIAVSSRSVWTNSIYGAVWIKNADTVSRTGYAGYLGFKVKSSSIRVTKLFPTERLLRELKARNNPHSSVTLPDWCKPLEPYAFIDFQGDVSILFEKDVPLRVDESGHVVEKLTLWVKLKDFERLFGDLIADITKRPLMTFRRSKSVTNKMGLEKYIDKWKAEGIEV